MCFISMQKTHVMQRSKLRAAPFFPLSFSVKISVNKFTENATELYHLISAFICSPDPYFCYLIAKIFTYSKLFSLKINFIPVSHTHTNSLYWNKTKNLIFFLILLKVTFVTLKLSLYGIFLYSSHNFAVSFPSTSLIFSGNAFTLYSLLMKPHSTCNYCFSLVY